MKPRNRHTGTPAHHDTYLRWLLLNNVAGKCQRLHLKGGSFYRTSALFEVQHAKLGVARVIITIRPFEVLILNVLVCFAIS